ncbi:MAG: transposase [Bryobacteraceae bacterium]
MRTYRRRLPHIDAPGKPTFLTWRLWGSLPPERVFEPEHLTSGQAFVVWDRLLDTARYGPIYLRQTEIASIVQEQLQKSGSDGLCTLHAFVIMPNHVHALCTPAISLPDLVRRVKGRTAYVANGRLGRRGEKFWQDEFFDRIVRNEGEFNQIQRYIEWNPVKAGLVARPEQFPWSSAWRG